MRKIQKIYDFQEEDITMKFTDSIIPLLINELRSGKASPAGGIIPDIQKSDIMDAVRQCIENYNTKAAERTGYGNDFPEERSGRPEIMQDSIFYVRNSSVKILTGDILNSKCDVIVSSDDDLITQGGGISEAGKLSIMTPEKIFLPSWGM